MSFILDALKKSETERQQQGAAEFSAIPLGSDSPKTPKWLWVVAVLLTANIIFLAVIFLRPDSPPPPATAANKTPTDNVAEMVPEAATASPNAIEPQIDEKLPVSLSFEQQVAAARENQPAPQAAAEPPKPATTSAIKNPTTAKNYMMTFDEARVQGLFQMVDLHVDIHVFGDTAADRFVFINMAKHRENSALAEGPTVREITTDGVILEYQGTTFLLPRD
jgi:general secretion pathway protein B